MERDADRIIAEIAQRVDSGMQLDEIPGRVGPGDKVPAALRSQGRIYTRGTSDFEAALAQGLLTPLARPALATESAVERAESLVGAALPDLLRRLYLEVANGGFGPAYGVLGLDNGFRDDMKRTALDILDNPAEWPGIPMNFLPLCHWGCAIYSFVHCPSGTIFGWDPNPVGPEDDVSFFEQEHSIETWLASWLDGTLRQPLLMVDPKSGQYRPATIEESATAFDDES